MLTTEGLHPVILDSPLVLIGVISCIHLKFFLSSSAIAPFVYVESRNIPGRFSDNGMLILKGTPTYYLTFESWEPIDIKRFSSGLKIR